MEFLNLNELIVGRSYWVQNGAWGFVVIKHYSNWVDIRMDNGETWLMPYDADVDIVDLNEPEIL